MDTDGDGLSDFQEIHKYRTDPKKLSTAGDGVSDGDRQRRREFTYSIRSVVKVMPPVNVECLNDDYQDARVLSRGENFVELEVIHYPLNTNAEAIRGNPDWRRDAESKKEYVRPGITTNWDDAMRRDLIAALKADGIDPDRLDDKELVTRASAWLMANSKYVNMFCTHYMHYPEGRAAIYPGLEARFEREKGDRGLDGAGAARSRAVRPLDVREPDAWIVHVVGRVPDDGPACPGDPDPHGPGHPDGRRQRPGAAGDGPRTASIITGCAGRCSRGSPAPRAMPTTRSTRSSSGAAGSG